MTFSPYPFFLFLGVLLCGCRGERDESPPQIVINTPQGSLPTYSYGDAFAVGFTVTDNLGAERWQIRLTDEEGIRRFSTDYFTIHDSPASSQQHFTVVCDDVHWPSGDYTLAVFAADAAGNEGAAFKTLRYFEAPLERRGITVLRDGPGISDFIDTLNSDGSFSTAYALQNNSTGILAGSYHGEWLIWSPSTAALLFLSPDDFELTGISNFSNPLNAPFFHDLVFEPSSQSYFVSCFDGLIREYGQGGQLRGTITTGSNTIPKDLYADEEFVYATIQPVNSNDITLFARYFKNSGALNTTTAISGSNWHILPFGDDLLLLGNTPNGEGAVYLADPSTLNLGELPWLASDEAIRHAIALDNGDYALATASGVWMYRFGTGQFVPASSNGVSVDHLAFDRVDNVLYATSEGAVYRINRQNGSVVASYPTSDAVATAVLYNK